MSGIKERTLSISEVQREITSLPEQFTEPLEAVIVTRYGKPAMAILPHYTYKALLETLEGLQETLEIMKDPELMEALRESIQAMERGETIPWEDVKKELEKQDEMENSIHHTSAKSGVKHQRHPYQNANQQAH